MVDRWWLGSVGGHSAFAMVWQLGKAVKAERARELFRLQHEQHEEQLLKSACRDRITSQLNWLSCQIIGDAVLVREMATGAILALVPVIIHFEPIPGSDMEEMSQQPETHVRRQPRYSLSLMVRGKRRESRVQSTTR